MSERGILREKQYTYKPTTGQTIVPAVTLDEFKAYAKITNAAEDAVLQSILDSALEFGQAFTKRVFTTTEFKTYRDEFISRSNVIELRKSPVQSISTNGFQYYNESDVLVDVDTSTYIIPDEEDFGIIALKNNSDWPDDLSDDRPYQSVVIIFKAGYGDAATDVPAGLKTAVKQHALFVAENRGDCADCSCDLSNLPSEAKIEYNFFKIKELRLGF
jgi:uncharacterized phiE125 gp8 family phage protein